VPRFGTHPVDPEIAASVAGAARVLASLDMRCGKAKRLRRGGGGGNPGRDQPGRAGVADATAWRCRAVLAAVQALAASGGAMLATTLFDALGHDSQIAPRRMTVFFEPRISF